MSRRLIEQVLCLPRTQLIIHMIDFDVLLSIVIIVQGNVGSSVDIVDFGLPYRIQLPLKKSLHFHFYLL